MKDAQKKYAETDHSPHRSSLLKWDSPFKSNPLIPMAYDNPCCEEMSGLIGLLQNLQRMGAV